MAIEQGVVTRIGIPGSTSAWVKMVRSSSCASCASRDSCKVGESGQTQEVEALNPVHARVGDRIQLAIGSGSLLKAMFLLYLFPVICMLIGGLLGNWLGSHWMINPSVLSVVSAVLFLVLAMVIVRIGGRRMAAKTAYQPRIVRILGRDATPPTAPDHFADTLPENALSTDATIKNRV